MYFTDLLNLIDIARISTVFYFVMSKQIGYEVQAEFKAAMFFLLWIKIFKYLSVFSAFRYFVMMVGETIADIKTFLTILFIAMIAYGQIMLTLSEGDDYLADFKGGYVLSLGDLGSFDEYGIM